MKALEHLFFRRIPVTGFGLMRIGWAFVVLIYDGTKAWDITRYFSADGLLTPEIATMIVRTAQRFSIFDTVTSAEAVFALYLVLLFACVCMIVGVFPRLMTIVAVLLLFSFHERNPLSLGGGDTVLRNIGFLLILAPTGRAFSLRRLQMHWREWKLKRRLLPPATMAAWPQVLLLWQLGVIYVTSGWDKMVGSMWIGGTAVNSALHHPHFTRLPLWMMDYVSPISPTIAYAVIVFEFSWLLLLLPNDILLHLGLSRGTVKRALLVMGILFHGGIFLLMDVGSFSWAMMIAYLGILETEDFAVLRDALNRAWGMLASPLSPPRERVGVRGHQKLGTIAVLYDGHCGLCQRSVFVLALLDHLRRLRLVDFHDEKLRMKIAPDLTLKQLDRALHIRIQKPDTRNQKRPKKLDSGFCPPGRRPDRTGTLDSRTLKGFDALRALSWHLPPLWPIAPFFYLPGVAPLGRRIYGRVAAARRKCVHGVCPHR